MGAMSPWHWAIVILVLVILFGSKKLPDAARGLGRSLRIFKSEMKEMQHDGETPASADVKPATSAQPVAPAQLEPRIETTPVQPPAAHHPDSKSA